MGPMSEPAVGVEERPGAAVPTFEEFFHREHRPLYGALRLLTRDGHEAEELMQDAFLKVLERWDRVAAMDDPTGYLFRTAMNLYRSRRRRLAVALRRAVRPPAQEDQLEAVEEREDVIRALAPLTPGQRAAVVLTDVLGLTSAEAAEALHVKSSTVRVLAARGRAVLRKEMGDG
jgi:RNA polymerase sigma-70 factor (ECF subfamily)